MFAADDEGSAGPEAACDEDYRGPYALSEPETQAIDSFVTRWSNIKVAINLHAFGNLFIVPFNYLSEKNSTVLED